MFSVAELAKLLQLSYQGEGTRVLTRVSSWEEADDSCLIFLDGKSLEQMPLPPFWRRVRDRSCPSCRGPAGPRSFLKTPSWILPELRIAFFPAARAALECAIRAPTVEAGATLGTRGRPGRRSRGVCWRSRGPWMHSPCRRCRRSGCMLGDDCILHPHVVLYPGAQSWQPCHRSCRHG